MTKFLRSDSTRHSRLGKNRRKLLKWRKPKGKSDKTRLSRTGYPIKVKIGFKKDKTKSTLIKGFKPVLVHNINQMVNLTNKNVIIIAKVGAKKKIDIIKKADEMKIKIVNFGGKK